MCDSNIHETKNILAAPEPKRVSIGNIPALIWGKESDEVIIAAHGSRSSKSDDCIRVLAAEANRKGLRVISFDFPRHGERADETALLMPDECVRELRIMYDYAAREAKRISLFGCSMGAYFELLAFADADIERAYFLSPVVDMEKVIKNIMSCCGVTEEDLRRKVFIDNDIEPLYYPYFAYVKAHPIEKWAHRTFILRGENDAVSDSAAVQSFAQKHGCELITQMKSEHWFHTEEQLSFFAGWLDERLV